MTKLGFIATNYDWLTKKKIKTLYLFYFSFQTLGFTIKLFCWRINTFSAIYPLIWVYFVVLAMITNKVTEKLSVQYFVSYRKFILWPSTFENYTENRAELATIWLNMIILIINLIGNYNKSQFWLLNYLKLVFQLWSILSLSRL